MTTYRICVYGIVQGVGFRPFVSRIADRIGIKGSVANRGSYVEIFAQASDELIDEFMVALEAEAPERSAILKVTRRPLEDDGDAYPDFQIIESEKEKGDIFVSPDIATCPKCKQELYDPTNRRYMHPFINCTACGPRLTILDAMPYDRERTSMGEFPMCPECEFEYTHAETRRYDAQPVCCNDCGPEVYLVGREERGREAITLVRKAIIDGQIIAIKGIGGFHLCCDATNEEAVARLRRLKRRPAKPFAIMARDLEAASRECEIPGDEVLDILDGHQKPIILLKRKKDSRLAPSVAPDNPKVGIMLPYAPVQMLLFDYNDGIEMTTDCFVMTSGNVSGAPICRTDEDAVRELSGFCDLILSHNRKIRLRADDSVMDMYRGKPYMIRRSRGYAPLPVMTEMEQKRTALAIGGELKNTFCIARGQLFYESPYVGDMEDLRTVKALEESVDRMNELLEAEPEAVICDMHPKYNTTLVAERYGEKHQLPVMKIQHHYAHILSCMAENDYWDQVIGLSMDGTGYGLDGTIWGGEILKCTPSDFQRIGSVMPFAQAGGDASAREGWRIAAAMINALEDETAAETAELLGLCQAGEIKLVGQMVARNINCVRSTSAGRLFDAVSAILGVRRTSSFEGEASTTLQFRAEEYLETAGRQAADAMVEQVLQERPELLAADNQEEMRQLRTDQLVKYIVQQRTEAIRSSQGQADSDTILRENQCRLAYLFHAVFARQMTELAKTACHETDIDAVALSGGVFQNTLLLGLCEDDFGNSGLRVLRHHMIPPNDGGIALGQAFAGIAALNRAAEI